ncbi:hypothetical protein Tco_0742859 [Tanacetum coccineum]
MITKEKSDIEDKSSGPSIAMQNPPLATRQNLPEDFCFISHGDQHISIGFLISRSLILKRWQTALASDHQINKVPLIGKHQSDTLVVFTVKMEILREPTSIKLCKMKLTTKYRKDSNSSEIHLLLCLSAFDAQVTRTLVQLRNPVKEILLNLPNTGSFPDVFQQSSDEPALPHKNIL